ncbi:inositol monophosphatase [Acetobacter estunensis NRIC 0472]|uniref:Histidinol phosphate phosphatase n=1 Tax=Acetobacter estunensis TaxID=104097 RepID=A0A967BB93_9PROT|nr:inositol monophosphatase family protein [Acetobacter estunensis]NHO53162.1 histidinol phosphate phosphatase [Acetobacter estunensis]GBQ24898.1 inositol monophosphatase [Acetobacter estunensis NRIC 0472]
MSHDLDTFAATANALADVAGTVIRPWFRTSVGIDDKADESPVTIADRTAERVMRAVLAERHPDHAILGEEFGLHAGNSDWQWTLDPIDGTRAFITGRPTFGTLISLSHAGTPVIGVIDQPITGERWIGVAGRGTLFRPGFGSLAAPHVIRTRACASLAQADLSCTAVEMLEDAPRPTWKQLKAAVHRVSWGGDCYAYGLLALGQIDVIAECTMKPWDWAALVPVIEGAGGRVTDWNGQILRADGDGTVLAVGNPALLDAAVSCLKE